MTNRWKCGKIVDVWCGFAPQILLNGDFYEVQKQLKEKNLKEIANSKIYEFIKDIEEEEITDEIIQNDKHER